MLIRVITLLRFIVRMTQEFGKLKTNLKDEVCYLKFRLNYFKGPHFYSQISNRSSIFI